jgi:inosose dehydratase
MRGLRVANAPCSWGDLELAEGAGAPSADQVLREMAQAGYEGTELGDWGFLPTEPAALAARLAAHDLALVGAFVPVAWARPEALTEGQARALRTARLLAAVAPEGLLVLSDDNGADPRRAVSAGRVRPELSLERSEWRAVGERIERVADAVRDATGLRAVFHHHGGGYVETPDEIARLLDATRPEKLGLCLDTGHYALGGGDPTRALTRFAGRVQHVHLKDFAPEVLSRGIEEGWGYLDLVRHGVFPELGRGAVDFPTLLARLRDADHSGFVVVEQDVLPGMGRPLESARRNRDYLNRLGL